MEIVNTVGLTKIYGRGENKVEALKSVDLSIKQGEFVAIVGPSGSGKSTLLHLIGGVDRPTSGKVMVDGEDVYSLSESKLAIFRRRKVGFIFQSYNLIPVLTAEENVMLPLLLDRREVDKAYLSDLLKLLGLEARKRHLPSELSGGQQQRVSIGRALAYKPSIILADEPTGNLDSKSGTDVMRILRQLHSEGRTVILITHDNHIAETAERIVRISDGKICEDYKNPAYVPYTEN